jgi:hypothetical protein
MTTSFFHEYAQSVVLERFPTRAILLPLLSSARALCRHTNVVYIQGSQTDNQWVISARKLIWSHPSIRPHGTPLPIQCPECKCIHSWKCSPPAQDGSITVTCTGKTLDRCTCSRKWTVPKPLTWSKLDGRQQGSWMEEIL